MLLTIDVGNSNTVFIVYDENEDHLFESRIITVKSDFNDYYKKNLKQIQCPVDAIVISCVVPAVLDTIVGACKEIYSIEPLVVSGETIQSLDIELENPLEIGADFIATSIGAITKYKAPVIVADIGSATKLTFTHTDRRFMGGVILPGLATSVRGLTEFIPHLPEVALSVPNQVVGNSTEGAIQAGILYGLIAQVEGIAKRMEVEKGVTCQKILTGGYAPLIASYLPDFIYDENLLNDGLRTIYREGLLKK